MRRLPQALISVIVIGFALRDYQSIGLGPFYAFFILLSLGTSIEMSRLVCSPEKTGWKGVWLYGLILPISAMIMIIGQQRLWWVGVDISAVTIVCALLFAIHIGMMIAYIVNTEQQLRATTEKKTLTMYVTRPMDQLATCYVIMFYIGLPVTLIILFSSYHNGLMLILCAAALTILFDTSSYLCGSFLAKKKGVVAVSPQKSIAGYIGGTVITLIATTTFLVTARSITLSVGFAIMVSCATIVAAIIGDLFESALKRNMQKKDSGRLVKGRGGLLDSFDSHLVSIPVFCTLSLWIIQ